MSFMHHTYDIVSERRRSDIRSCRLIEIVCFVVFLPIALLAGISGWRWRPWPPTDAEGYGSAFGEARSMARLIAGIAISG
jgi:hypothetical protein